MELESSDCWQVTERLLVHQLSTLERTTVVMLKRVHRVDVPFPLCEAIETLSIRLGSLRTRRQYADQTDWYEELREALFSEGINFSMQSQLILCLDLLTQFVSVLVLELPEQLALTILSTSAFCWPTALIRLCCVWKCASMLVFLLLGMLSASFSQPHL